MFLNIVRTRKDLSEVLYNPQAGGPDPVYLVFSKISDEPWENITITSPGLLDKEYPKTYGHYHPDGAPTETFKVLFGTGCFLLQEKYFEGAGQNTGKWVKNKVKRVILVKVEKDEVLTVTPNWAHSCSNLGGGPLVTVDDWAGGHTPSDYRAIKDQKGFAYYLIEENGRFDFVKNPNYTDPPKPMVMTAEEFAKYQKEKI